MSGTDTSDWRPRVGDREISLLRVVTLVCGLGLLGSYLLPWVDIVDAVVPAGEDGGLPDPDRIAAQGETTEGTIAATELTVYPEIVLSLGVLALGLALVGWHRWIHVGVVLVGFAGTGVGLVMREVLRAEETIIEIGPYVGHSSAFEPGIGIWLVIALSILLINVGAAAALLTLDER